VHFFFPLYPAIILTQRAEASKDEHNENVLSSTLVRVNYVTLPSFLLKLTDYLCLQPLYLYSRKQYTSHAFRLRQSIAFVKLENAVLTGTVNFRRSIIVPWQLSATNSSKHQEEQRMPDCRWCRKPEGRWTSSTKTEVLMPDGRRQLLLGQGPRHSGSQPSQSLIISLAVASHLPLSFVLCFTTLHF